MKHQIKTVGLLAGIILFFYCLSSQGLEVTLDSETKSLLKEATEDQWLKKDIVASTLLGAMAALGATWFAHWLQQKKEDEQDREFVERVLRAIESELEAIRKLYASGIGEAFNNLPEGKPLLIRMSLTENFFTVYEANTVHLGKLPPEIACQIITVYMLMKGVIEDFRINNDYISRHERTQIYTTTTSGPRIRTDDEAIDRLLREQAGKLRNAVTKLDQESKRLEILLSQHFRAKQNQ